MVGLARSLKPSARGELEITDLNRLYLERRPAARGDARARHWPGWTPARTIRCSRRRDFVRAIQNRQGLKIACIEEIALLKGWISREQLALLIDGLGKTSYAEYLRAMVV